MWYEYCCEKCSEIVEKEYPLGKAAKKVKCKCGGSAQRYFGSMTFQLKGEGWPGKDMSFNKEMTKRNDDAGHRMRKERKPGMTLAALDYGNGDIREVKKK